MRQINLHVAAVAHGGRCKYATKRATSAGDHCGSLHTVELRDDKAMEKLLAGVMVDVLELASIEGIKEWMAFKATGFAKTAARPSSATYKEGKWYMKVPKHKSQPLFKWWAKHPLHFTAGGMVLSPEPRYFPNAAAHNQINSWSGFAITRDDAASYTEVRYQDTVTSCLV